MIKEAYCSYKVAKLLKEKDFNGLCSACFDPNDKSFKTIYYNTSGEVEPQDWNNLSRREAGKIGLATWYGYISAPTLQMAIAWLRKKGIAIVPIISSILDNESFLWDIKIVIAKTNETYRQGWVYEEYENAINDALEYVLENLL